MTYAPSEDVCIRIYFIFGRNVTNSYSEETLKGLNHPTTAYKNPRCPLPAVLFTTGRSLWSPNTAWESRRHNKSAHPRTP